MITTTRETTSIEEVDHQSRGKGVPTAAEAEVEVVHQPTIRGAALEAIIVETSLRRMLRRSHEA